MLICGGRKGTQAESYRVLCKALPSELQVVDIGRHGNNKDHGVGINNPVADIKQFRIKSCRSMTVVMVQRQMKR